MARRRVIVSWSSGKDAAWAVHLLRQKHDVEVVGLMTTFNSEVGRASMHGVREKLVEEQAHSLMLPLRKVYLPSPCTNEEYERVMASEVAMARSQRIEAIAFGDINLADIRSFREEKMKGSGVDPLFPLWGLETRSLAEEMLSEGLRAVLVCVDPSKLDRDLAGKPWDPPNIRFKAPDVDPCGENGEYHTFAYAGPMFRRPIKHTVKEIVERDGMVYADLA